jgi:hypothetical protein
LQSFRLVLTRIDKPRLSSIINYYLREMLLGAVGIENNTDRNFKDLEEMLGSAKTLTRKDRESLLAP